MTIQHIDELFVLDGQEFVSAAYHTLLGRAPDAHGLAYYLGRMARGFGKAEILVNLATAPEARSASNIPGVAHLIAEDRRSRHWFWGWFGGSRRIERQIRQLALEFAGAHASMQHLSEALNATQESLQHIAQQLPPHPIALDEEVVTPAIVVQPLSADQVCQAFNAVLGRMPESSDVIVHHASYESPQQLKTVLMQSDEFRNKTEVDYSKFLLARLVQAAQ